MVTYSFGKGESSDRNRTEAPFESYIMKVILEKSKEYVGEIIFVTNYYDGPLSGLCKYNGQLCKFTCVEEDDDGTRYFDVYSLTPWEKIKALWNKKKFELCVGYHCSYKNNKKQSYFYYRKPQWFYKWLFRMYFRKTFRGKQ